MLLCDPPPEGSTCQPMRAARWRQKGRVAIQDVWRWEGLRAQAGPQGPQRRGGWDERAEATGWCSVRGPVVWYWICSGASLTNCPGRRLALLSAVPPRPARQCPRPTGGQPHAPTTSLPLPISTWSLLPTHADKASLLLPSCVDVVKRSPPPQGLAPAASPYAAPDCCALIRLTNLLPPCSLNFRVITVACVCIPHPDSCCC